MPSVTANTLPRHEESTIYQGRPWQPVTVRFRDPDGVYEAIEVQAHVCTAPVADGGEVVARCDTTAVSDEGWAVSLDSAGTRALPPRQLFAEVLVKRTGEEWKTAIFYILAVEPELSVPVVSLVITGGSTVAVGDILSLTATATLDDASTEVVTASCVWTSSVPAKATVPNGAGYVVGVSAGATTITASLGSVSDDHVVTAS